MSDIVTELVDNVDELDRARDEKDETTDTTDADVSTEDSESESESTETIDNDSTDDTSADTGDDNDDDDNVDAEEEKRAATEIKSLRQMVRAQKQQLKHIEEQLGNQNKALVDKDILTEDEVETTDTAAQEQKTEHLNALVEIMELNPKFEDVRDVCTQGNFDDVTEMLANAYVEENGGDVEEVIQHINTTIWEKTNPYKEMYSLIKTYHPEYSKKEVVAEMSKKKEAKIAPSLSDIPAAAKVNTSGWSNEKIDSLDEEELDKVPTDVYEKYMRGELD